MQRNLSILITAKKVCLLLAIAMLFQSSSRDLSAEVAKSKKHHLHYDFKAGDFVHYRVKDVSAYTTQKDEIKETAKNQSIAWRQYRVVSVDANGEAVLELMIERVRLQTQFDDSTPVIFDSSDPKLQSDRFKGILKTVGKPMSRIRVNKQGKLLKVQNFFGEQPEEVDPTLNFLVVFPEHKIAIGESWTQILEVEVAVTKTLKEKVKLLRKYHLNAVDGDVATISLTTALITKIRDPAVKVRLMQQTPAGTILFDIKKHLLVKRELATDGQVVGAFGAGTLVSAISKRLEEIQPASVAKRESKNAKETR